MLLGMGREEGGGGERERERGKGFLFVMQTIVTHEEKKSCVHVVSIFRRELTSRLKARL